MTTATAERSATERESLIRVIGELSDTAISQLKGYADRVREEELEAIDAEIAALEAKYGTTPNAETIAAMKELDEGGGEVVTMDELRAMLDEIE